MSTVIHGDCLAIMPSLDANSIDAIVTDPPYGLQFMGHAWDHGVPGVPFWKAALRVAKPGAYLVAFGGTRTHHRLMVAIEDAGWEIRDTLMWLYGVGFPKSHDISKAIDKAAGGEGAWVQEDHPGRPGSRKQTGGNWESAQIGHSSKDNPEGLRHIYAPATAAAKQWQGWGTALKPAWEPIILARKPIRGTVAANVLEHGTGALNVDACRAPAEGLHVTTQGLSTKIYGGGNGLGKERAQYEVPSGRWPSNVVLGCACETEHEPDCAVRLLDEQSGERKASGVYEGDGILRGGLHVTAFGGAHRPSSMYDDSGGASRFFYTAKSSRAERDFGLDEIPRKPFGYSGGASSAVQRGELYEAAQSIGLNRVTSVRNTHATVKPLDLMRWLVRLVTPPGGVILDPFCGSGTTGCAAVLEGFGFIGIEQDEHSVEIARHRIAAQQPSLFGVQSTGDEAKAGPKPCAKRV